MNDTEVKCLVCVFHVSGTDVHSAANTITSPPAAAMDTCLESWDYENGRLLPTHYMVEITDKEGNSLYQGSGKFETWRSLGAIVEGGWRELIRSPGTIEFGRCQTFHPKTHPFKASNESDRHLQCEMVPH